MADDAAILKDLREASLETAALHLKLLHELKRSLTDLRRLTEPACGWSAAIEPADHPAPRARGEEMLVELARFSLQTYERWLQLSSKHFDSFVAAIRHPYGRPVHAGRSRLALSLARRHGETAVAGFEIENPWPVRAEVSFTLPVFRDDDGDAPFSPQVKFRRVKQPPHEEPRGFSLGASRSGQFSLAIELRDPFVAGRRYAGESSVLVGDRVIGTLAIDLEVL
ncbi:MAG TPA: hypothetical protein VEI94_07275 [Candidatus Bathyarchaeia archaeon]|nr:hypothetical protein [Candidatus Bathyarchaeia archaeon]